MARTQNITIELVFDDGGAVAGVKQFGNETERAGKKAQGAGDQIRQLLADVRDIGLAIDGAKKIVSIFDGMSAGYRDFETALTNVNSLVGLNEQSIKGVGNELLKISSELGESSTDMANAAYQAVSAGMDIAKVPEFIRQATQAAVAGVSDVTTAVDVGTTLMNAWKMEAEDSGRVYDTLFNIVKGGKTDFNALSHNFATVAAVAASAKVDIEEVGGALITLTQSGTPTAQAMTQIRSAILSVQEKMGQSAFQTMSFQQAMVKMREEGDKSGKSLQSYVGRVEALQAVLGLSGENAEKAAKHLADMMKSSGAMTSAYNIQAEQMEKRMQRVGVIWHNTVITLVGEFEPLITGVLEGLTNLVTAAAPVLVELADMTAGAISVMKEYGDVILAVVGTLGTFYVTMKAITLVQKAYTALNTADSVRKWAMKIPALILALKGQTVATTAATGATVSFGAALNAALGPVGWVTLAISGLVGAYFLLRGSTEDAIEAQIKQTEAQISATESLIEHEEQAKSLAEEYQRLYKIENKGNEEKERMAEILRELKGYYPGVIDGSEDFAEALSKVEKIAKDADKAIENYSGRLWRLAKYKLKEEKEGLIQTLKDFNSGIFDPGIWEQLTNHTIVEEYGKAFGKLAQNIDKVSSGDINKQLSDTLNLIDLVDTTIDKIGSDPENRDKYLREFKQGLKELVSDPELANLAMLEIKDKADLGDLKEDLIGLAKRGEDFLKLKVQAEDKQKQLDKMNDENAEKENENHKKNLALIKEKIKALEGMTGQIELTIDNEKFTGDKDKLTAELTDLQKELEAFTDAQKLEAKPIAIGLKVLMTPAQLKEHEKKLQKYRELEEKYRILAISDEDAQAIAKLEKAKKDKLAEEVLLRTGLETQEEIEKNRANIALVFDRQIEDITNKSNERSIKEQLTTLEEKKQNNEISIQEYFTQLNEYLNQLKDFGLEETSTFKAIQDKKAELLKKSGEELLEMEKRYFETVKYEDENYFQWKMDNIDREYELKAENHMRYYNMLLSENHITKEQYQEEMDKLALFLERLKSIDKKDLYKEFVLHIKVKYENETPDSEESAEGFIAYAQSYMKSIEETLLNYDIDPAIIKGVMNEIAKEFEEAANESKKLWDEWSFGEKVNWVADQFTQNLQQLSSFIDTERDMLQERYDRKMEALELQKERELNSEVRSAEEKYSIEQEYAEKELAMREELEAKDKEMRRKQHTMKVVEAQANTITAAINSFVHGTKIAGPELGAILAGIALAWGTAKTIQLQKMKAYKGGGKIYGDEQVIRVNEEGTESVVNAPATAKYYPAIEKMNKGASLLDIIGTLITGGSIQYDTTPKFAFRDGGMAIAPTLSEMLRAAFSNTMLTNYSIPTLPTIYPVPAAYTTMQSSQDVMQQLDNRFKELSNRFQQALDIPAKFEIKGDLAEDGIYNFAINKIRPALEEYQELY